ncbi:hypothetical protein TWF281_001368 [Arthrobotrys megalospora]
MRDSAKHSTIRHPWIGTFLFEYSKGVYKRREDILFILNDKKFLWHVADTTLGGIFGPPYKADNFFYQIECPEYAQEWMAEWYSNACWSRRGSGQYAKVECYWCRQRDPDGDHMYETKLTDENFGDRWIVSHVFQEHNKRLAKGEMLFRNQRHRGRLFRFWT